MARETLVISNHWHNPGVTVAVRHDADSPNGAISLETGLDDFILALSAEMRNPLGVWTRAQLTQALAAASVAALAKLKEASTAGMALQ